MEGAVTEEIKSVKPQSHFRHWLKRLFIGSLLLLIGLVVFHRPLILALVRWAGPQGAATQGLSLTWVVNGSLWEDLEITDLKAGGGLAHWLPKATIGKLALSYDPSAVLEHIVKGVTIHDLEADLDLRHLPASDGPAKEVVKSAATGKAPALVWPGFLDLKNINANVTLADGKKVMIQGLTLQVGAGMPGVFECRSLSVQPDGLRLENLKAQVAWKPRSLVIKGFSLPTDIVLDELLLDLKDFESGTFETNILAHLGAAKVAISGSIADAFGSNLKVKVDTQISDLSSLELQTLGLPEELLFEHGTLNLHLEGDPLTPPLMKVQTQFAAANIRAAGAKIDKVEFDADIADSAAKVHMLRFISGSNLIEFTADAKLPQKIEEWQKTAWSAVMKAKICDLTQLLETPPPASGNILLQAKAKGVGSTSSELSGTLNGDTLSFQEYRLPKLATQFSLNGKEARFEIPGLELGTGNQLAVKATLLIDDAMPVKAEWKFSLSEPTELFKTIGLKAPDKTISGMIDLAGKADFKMKDLSAGHYEGLLADLHLQVQKGQFGESQLPSVSLEVHTQGGKAQVKPCSIRFDDENHLELSADVAMKPPFAFSTQGSISMPTLVKLNALLASFAAPQLKSGSLFSNLNAAGQIQPWQCEGKATVIAAKVHPANLPEPADLKLEAAFAGTRAELKSIEAKLGLWKLAMKGVVDDKSANLSQMRVWQKDILLMEGHASAPLDIMQASKLDSVPVDVVMKAKDLRLNEVLAAVGIKDIPSGIFNADIAIKGRLETLDGVVKINLRDVQVPKGPKAFTPATLDLDATLRGDQMKSLIKWTQPPLQPLTVNVTMPLDVDAVLKKPALINDIALKIAVRMAESDLGFLREYAPDMIQNLPVKLKLNADVTGTVSKPLIQAAVDLDAKEVSWFKADMPSVRDVRVRLRVSDRKLTIEDLSLLMAGGRVKIDGSVDAADTKNPALNLNIKAREALVFRDPTTSLRANADLTCVGSLAAARVAGLVEAVRGRVFKEIDLMPVLKLPADVPPVPENTQRSEAKLILPTALKDWTFDLRVKTRDPLLISGNLANGAISADLLLSGTGVSPQLTGKANMDRLLLKLPFSLVKITKGVVTMKPQTPFDPSLDIRGESRIGNNDITLYVYGRSTNPKTRFVSSPPMSEPDIVTLIATGTTLNGSASDLASEAASRAALLFISELYRKTFNQTKTVREEPPRLHMSVNPSGGDRSSDAVQATYDLSDKWRITGRFTQAGRMKALLGYVLRFGQAAKAVDEKR
jgi:autotransporter translocation and assembly factor TamB